MSKDPLSDPIQYVKGVGPKLSQLLGRKGIRTIEDGLYFLPRCYEDRRVLKKISALRPGERGTSSGEVLLSGAAYYGYGKRRVFEVIVTDGSGNLRLKWFRGNERYLRNRFQKGCRLVFSGDVKWFNGQREIHHPDVEMVDGTPEEDFLNFNRIVPVYSETEGLRQKTLRKIAHALLEGFGEQLRSPIPREILERQRLMDVQEAFRYVHFPPNDASVEQLNRLRSEGHRRIVFEEFFFLELGLALRKRGRGFEPGLSFRAKGKLSRQLMEQLPFRPTKAQERVIAEIRRDMEKPCSMNRLIQGDVGSGKTLVALEACLHVIECGYQTAIMAPTEVLAEQHYLNLHRWVEPLGIRVALLTGSTRGAERDELYRKIRKGDCHLVIGTHAVIQEDVEFRNLGLAIIDEQHRFGVCQRGLLRKKGESPDILIMTATPIPRTLAMTVYGDLDVSVLDEMPPGRVPVETTVFPEAARKRVYRLVEEEVKKGRQAFIVYPLVEESEKVELKDATRMAEHLQREVFAEWRVGLLHGRMKSDEKESVMRAFKDGKVEILVATTVIEVGIDVPNASIMVVEHAERFGLSQLHQLRGRIGRGQHPSRCILLAQYRSSEEARARLKAMERTRDGFEIAEEDLALRGPGEFFGIQQSGFPDFRIGHFVRDTAILAEARREAFELVERDPELLLPEHVALRETLLDRWKGRLELGRIG